MSCVVPMGGPSVASYYFGHDPGFSHAGTGSAWPSISHSKLGGLGPIRPLFPVIQSFIVSNDGSVNVDWLREVRCGRGRGREPLPRRPS